MADKGRGDKVYCFDGGGMEGYVMMWLMGISALNGITQRNERSDEWPFAIRHSGKTAQRVPHQANAYRAGTIVPITPKRV